MDKYNLYFGNKEKQLKIIKLGISFDEAERIIGDLHLYNIWCDYEDNHIYELENSEEYYMITRVRS